MSKFWPVVFWFQEKKNGYLIYRPSWSHHHGAPARPHKTYVAAMRWAQKKIGLDRHIAPNQNYMPIFIPYVIEGDKPKGNEFATLRLLVQRINVNPKIDD